MKQQKCMCKCPINSTQLIHCKHIVLFRQQNELPIVDLSLVNNRWLKKDNGKKEFQFVKSKETRVSVASSSIQRKLSKNKKFKRMMGVCKELADIASYHSASQFDNDLELLQDLLCHWKRGETV